MPAKKTLQQFIQQATEVHTGRYNYSKSKYINDKTKIIIICPDHGEFLQTPNNHLKHGCDGCATIHRIKTRSSNIEAFIHKAKQKHGDKYDYSKSQYDKNYIHVIIICPKHGKFQQTPSDHLSGKGCIGCKHDKNRKTTEQFIETACKIHGDTYNYSLVEYKTNNEPVIVICKKHGKFPQLPRVHISGQGCPSCKTSKGEKRIVQWLIKQDIEFIPQFKINQSIDDPDNNTGHGYDGMPEIKNLRFDFYLPYYDLFIEFDGEQHEKAVDYFGGEETLAKIQENDAIKNEFCERCHLDLLRINHREFDDIEQILDAKIKKKKEQGY